MIKKFSRRRFIGTSALASGSLLLPKFLHALGKPASAVLPGGDKILVVVQLSGGNDGLNTIIPYRNDVYYKNRRTISINENDILSLNDEAGFNPVMKGFKELYDNGNMCIINSVGYPNPDHSHFRSMDIWHTASGSDQYLNTGWIGRYLDAECPDCKPYDAIEMDDFLSLSMKGEKVNAFAIKDPENMYKITRSPYFAEVEKQHHTDVFSSSNIDYLYKTLTETYSSAEYIYDKTKTYSSGIEYPQDPFSKKLKLIAELINSGCESKVYYVSLSGFDSHVNQRNMQDRSLKMLSDGISSFTDDLKKNNKMDNVLIMTFSEFGRRVSQNASGGTDHGTANQVMIINGNLSKKGFYNTMPDLENLDEGDLKYKVDFRGIYATVLKKWLKADDASILKSKFELLNFV